MSLINLIIQIIGGLGYTTLVISYFKKEKKEILFIQIISYAFFTIHYYLLKGVTGAICNLLGLGALFLIYLFDEHKWENKGSISVIIIELIIIINIATFQNIFSIYPIIASVLAIISFLLNNENYIRGIGLIGAVCWLIYAIAYKSYITIGFEVFTLIGTILAFIKNNGQKIKIGKQQ